MSLAANHSQRHFPGFGISGRDCGGLWLGRDSYRARRAALANGEMPGHARAGTPGAAVEDCVTLRCASFL